MTNKINRFFHPFGVQNDGGVILSAAKNLLLIALLTGCTDRFVHMNTNPNQVTAPQMEVKNYRTGTKVTNLENIVITFEKGHLRQSVLSLKVSKRSCQVFTVEPR